MIKFMWGTLAKKGGRNADAVTIDWSDAYGRRELRNTTSPSTVAKAYGPSEIRFTRIAAIALKHSAPLTFSVTTVAP